MVENSVLPTVRSPRN